MSRVAFLGMGAMGSRMTAKLLASGYDVTVWNRTASRAQDLVNAGATGAETPRLAAEGADVVFSMVRDDEASRAVWLDAESGALAGLHSDAIAVECSTLSVPYVRELAGAFEQAGRAFLDAPLAGSRPQAEAGQLIFFVGGAPAVRDKVQPLLQVMGSAVHHAGGTCAGTTVKLMVNALFGAQLAVVAELIGFARKTGLDAEKALEIVGETPVCSPATKVAADAMLKGVFAPAFPIELVAKDFGLISQSASKVSAEIPVSTATGAVYESGVAKGYGEYNITGIVESYAKRD